MKVVRTPEERFAGLPSWPYEPRYVEVSPGLRMHYVDEGPRQAPPVLCVHGEPTWGYLYRKMIPGLLAAGHRVVIPDLIGFGLSDKPTRGEDYSYRAHVDWFARFVAELELADVLLFCQDWGGQIGIVHATERPDLYLGIVAANTGVLPGIDIPLAEDDPFRRWFRYAEELDPFRPSLVVAGPSPLNPTGFELSPAEAAAYDAPYPREEHCAGARRFPQLVVLSADDPAAELCRKTWKRLARLDVPFLTVVAEHEQGFNQLAPLLQQTIPGAAGRPHATIPGAGHFLQEHAPAALVELTDRFSAEL